MNPNVITRKRKLLLPSCEQTNFNNCSRRKVQRVWVSLAGSNLGNHHQALYSECSHPDDSATRNPFDTSFLDTALLIKQVMPLLLEMDRQLCRSYQQQLTDLQQWQADVFSQLYREQSAPPDSSYLC
jgi:hypothetical protein